MLNPAAFDAFAAEYDAEFSQTELGQMLRRRVWDVYERHFQPGQHLLELACGTGEDALWLARKGCTITATDGSTEMLAITQHKAQQAGMVDRVRTQPLPLQSLLTAHALPLVPGAFAGVYSNFGGLNTINTWRPLSGKLAQLIRPGGKMILVVMGPVCLWEMGWYWLHGRAKLAMRRFNQPTTAVIGQASIPIWYPSARRLRQAFAPWFRHVTTESLGLWLPPTYLGHLVERWPALFRRLNQVESVSAGLTGGWGDHYIIVLQRNNLSSELPKPDRF